MKTKTLFLIVLLAALALPVFGTTVPKMDFATLVNGADSIVHGKVIAIDTIIETAGNARRPFTRVRIHVDDPMKGDRRSTVFLKFLGGRMDTPRGPVEVSVSGMPQFAVGDNVILFLHDNRDAEGTHYVVGLNQGKYLVINETAISNMSGTDLVDPKTGKTLPSSYTESSPVDALKARIRELLK